MISSYFKIAWRNLVHNRSSSFINIGGLSVGIAVAMLIGLWIHDELTFNKVHQNHDRIAEVMWNTTANGQRMTYPYNPGVLGTELRRNYGPYFKYIVTSTFTSSNVLSYGDKKISKTGNYMEPQAPVLFSLNLIKGDIHGLGDPHSIMISQSTSKAIFGDDDPIGRMLLFNNILNVKITAVYKDLPLNSDFKDLYFIVPWDLLIEQVPAIRNDPSAWDFNNFQVFVQIADHVDLNQVSRKIRDIRKQNMSKESVHSMDPVVFLQPMNKWHLYSEFKNGVNVGGRIQYVWMFGIIGACVMLLACINFMNLSTARSEKRAKEVGIRKTIGSRRVHLISQFFTESLLIAIAAFVFSIFLVWISLPSFNALADKKMSIAWGNPLFWFLTLGFCAIVGLFAGIYPALYLSSFQPIKVLKGTFRVGRLASLPRKILVVLQFTVSVILIICTLVVFQQIQFAKNRSVGYNRNGLINLSVTPDIQKHFTVIRDDLKKSGAVQEMAGSVNSTLNYYVDVIDVSWKGKNPNTITDFAFNNISEDYGRTIDWQIKEGRNFSSSFPSDSSAFILNESAVKIIGLQHPIGEQIQRQGKTFTVIGVIQDIIFESPYKEVMPSIFYMTPRLGYATITIKLNPEIRIDKALSEIASVFRRFNPSFPFDYKFVDEEYAKKFNDEERIGKLSGFFTLLAIFISCLGLFGLTSFVAEQRAKEMIIRKVLGASILNVWSLLSKDFIILVLISLVIAIPLGYYFMHNWLQNYPYRYIISGWIFGFAAAGALGITLLTVSFQAIRAAIANPVKSLRTE